MWLKLWQNEGMSYKKNTQVEVLAVVDLCKNRRNGVLCGRCSTGLSNRSITTLVSPGVGRTALLFTLVFPLCLS